MPDFKLEYIVNNNPWNPANLGLIDDPDEETFYEMITGHDAQTLMCESGAIIFKNPIHFDDTESPEEYLSYLYLSDTHYTASNGAELQKVPDAGLAKTIQKPAVWTENGGEIITFTHDGKEIQLPEYAVVFEYHPVDEPFNTVAELQATLEDISGNSIYRMLIR